jgi:hypothetical protein
VRECVETSYLAAFCWSLNLNAALSYEPHRHLEGTVEADELYHTAGNKGQAKQGGNKAIVNLLSDLSSPRVSPRNGSKIPDVG